MAPQPLRGPTKKQAAQHPEALKANYLLQASRKSTKPETPPASSSQRLCLITYIQRTNHLYLQISQQIASSEPLLAAALCRSSLRLADAHGLPLPQGTQHNICERCGSPALASTPASAPPQVSATSRSFKRRQALRIKAGCTNGNKTIPEAVLIRTCPTCSEKNVRLLATMKAAEDISGNASGPRSAPEQQVEKAGT